MSFGFDGILHKKLGTRLNVPKDLFEQWKSRITNGIPRQLELILVQGFAGCGKSFPVSQMLQRHKNFLVSVPSTHLREAWKAATKVRDEQTWRVSTWETALLHHSSLLVVDEIYRIPPGYLDLISLLNPSLCSIIVLGDPLQGDYHSTNPESTLSRLEPETSRLRRFADMYCAWTYRLDQTTSSLLGIKTFSKEKGHPPAYKPNLRTGTTILTAAIQTANIFTQNGQKAQTAASSQGLTFNENVCLYLDRNIHQLGPHTSLVALTRSRRGIIYHGDFKQLEHLSNNSYPLQLIFGKAKGSVLDFFAHELKGLHVLHQPITRKIRKLIGAGPTFSRRWDDFSDILLDHRSKLVRKPIDPEPEVDDTFVPETKRVLLQHFNKVTYSDIETTEPHHSSPISEPVYPGCDYECLKYELLRTEDPVSLERVGPHGLTNQFPFLNMPYTEEAAYPGLIAPVHNDKEDPDLLALSIGKRLRFRRVAKSQISPEHQAVGHLLFQSYCEAYGIQMKPVEFDEQLFIDCVLENDYIQLTSKTKAAIIANASRSDPTWAHTVVRIFTKTQHKININSLFTGWKACQTLALMHDIVVLLLGPVKKYQRKMLARERTNPNIFLYGGKSPYELSEFARKHFPSGVNRIANDYTAYDQSQGPEAVWFEVLKMRRVGIPEDLIEFHEELKTTLTCQFGPLTPMRFTGEPGTYDDNSDYNLAIINLEYQLRDTPCLISGDDSLLAWEPRKRPSWAFNKQFFSDLVWKKETKKYGEFCGYYVGHTGAVRAPQPMLSKLGLSAARQELDKTLLSYLSEFCVGHSLGDDMWQILPPHEVLYQSAVFDFFNRHCSKSMKVCLKQGEVPPADLIKSGLPLSYGAFCTLPLSARSAYLRRHKGLPHAWAL
uniref:Putative viral helicase n=1 Tax=Sichuan mosquito tymo-like virus TaxID=2864015 RepID=A0A8K1HGP8_9VIRU|nr:putative viral helicase [Sichuan mosquito tymo-like virus]